MTGEIAGTGVLYACGKLKLFEEFVLLANGVGFGINSNKSTGGFGGFMESPEAWCDVLRRCAFLALIKHAVVSNE